MTGPGPLIADRLAKLIPRLASDHDGEVVATARAIGQTLAGAGLDFHDLAAGLTGPPAHQDWPEVAPKTRRRRRPSMQRMADGLAAHPDATDWARSFAADLARLLRRGYKLSAKQKARLRVIYDEVIGE